MSESLPLIVLTCRAANNIKSHMQKTPYTGQFYANQSEGSLRSARVVVPLVMDMIRPKSVVDVGCGVGTWLAAFSENGVGKVLGLDGDYVDTSKLLIQKENFRPTDLSRPFSINERFDLAVSLEVAEHLPGSSAEDFVKTLVTLAPVVMFSAAIPLQGGTNHINEQWPHYWANIFGSFNYRMLDGLRGRIWQDPAVEWCYRQNLFLFASEKFLNANQWLKKMEGLSSDLILVHKTILDKHLDYIPLKTLHKKLFRTLRMRIFGEPER